MKASDRFAHGAGVERERGLGGGVSLLVGLLGGLCNPPASLKRKSEKLC